MTNLLDLGSVVQFYGNVYGKVIGYVNTTDPMYRIITNCGSELLVDCDCCTYLFKTV